MEADNKERNADIITNILNSIDDCKECPMNNACDEIQAYTGDSLCRRLKDLDELDINI